METLLEISAVLTPVFLGVVIIELGKIIRCLNDISVDTHNDLHGIGLDLGSIRRDVRELTPETPEPLVKRRDYSGGAVPPTR
jgi:hypothetical protein